MLRIRNYGKTPLYECKASNGGSMYRDITSNIAVYLHNTVSLATEGSDEVTQQAREVFV
jgi:hypothetical protein